FECINDLYFFLFKNFLKQVFRKDQFLLGAIMITLYRDIIYIRVRSDGYIGRQRPWSGCPHQHRSVWLIYKGETHKDGRVSCIVIPLSNFMVRKWRATTWTIWHDFISLKEQIFFPKVFEYPPN